MTRRLALAALVALWPALASAQFATIAPTPPTSDNGDRVATTAFVNSAVNSVLPTPTRAGDLVYWNGSAWVTIAGNNSGTQFLQENSSGLPSWATVSSVGTVTSVTCGTGLSGGTFTTSGTCAVNYAVKSDQQTGSSAILAVSPSVQQQHDSAAKAWVSFTGSTGVVLSQYNIASVSRSAAGTYTVNFTVAFASASYACHVTTTGTGGGIIGVVSSKAVGSINIDALNISGAGADPAGAVDLVCYGRQ